MAHIIFGPLCIFNGTELNKPLCVIVWIFRLITCDSWSKSSDNSLPPAANTSLTNFNPLIMGTGNYSATSNKMVHWPLMGGLLHLVQQGGDGTGWGRSMPRWWRWCWRQKYAKDCDYHHPLHRHIIINSFAELNSLICTEDYINTRGVIYCQLKPEYVEDDGWKPKLPSMVWLLQH